MYRQRFSLAHHPIPKDAQGKRFFDKGPGYVKLKRGFSRLLEDGGLGRECVEVGRRGMPSVAVGSNVIGADGVDRDKNDVAAGAQWALGVIYVRRL